MAYSAHRVARSSDPERRPALALWWLQLGLNAAWSPIFFGARRPGAGAAVVCTLVPAVAATAVATARVDRPAGLLYAPYLAWSTYAAALNLSISAQQPLLEANANCVPCLGPRCGWRSHSAFPKGSAAGRRSCPAPSSSPPGLSRLADDSCERPRDIEPGVAGPRPLRALLPDLPTASGVTPEPDEQWLREALSAPK